MNKTNKTLTSASHLTSASLADVTAVAAKAFNRPAGCSMAMALQAAFGGNLFGWQSWATFNASQIESAWMDAAYMAANAK